MPRTDMARAIVESAGVVSDVLAVQWTRNPVKLVQHLMMAYPERFTLDLEVPAIPEGVPPQLGVFGEGPRPIRCLAAQDAFARGAELRDGRLERPADPYERRRALPRSAARAPWRSP